MPAHPYPLPKANHKLTVLAWNVVILISTLPEIIFTEITGSTPDLLYIKMAILLVLSLVAVFWEALHPLRNFFVIMLLFFGFARLFSAVDFTIPTLQRLFGGSVFDARMQAEQTGKLVISLLMVGTLLVMGYRRRQIFLAKGDLSTPMEPVKLLGFPKPDPWYRFALQWGVYIAAGLAVFQYLGLRPSGDLALKTLPLLPSILFYAALNAFNEEMTFRAPLLATLEPLAGSQQALWMSAYFFGIAHYFGTPGGLLGGVLSIFMGWILGKAMLETRGLFWAWFIHFLSDVVIFSFLSMALVKG